ncbi:spore germination-like protein [Paenibacillus larvae subsp. larvae]|uniref:Spore germination-like protein n=2 Tax=Paenibacillus larvae TaxID=1464 RepID=A0A2L1U0L6_9BACL|nr:spore germination protein GerPB [Paenibacillus larvae]AQT83331.1 hypothetical protein B1222_00880 [Paenibacillus larvae subsp. pulvifaciens]AQZ48467.1 hypothetical protein B5S25_19635 [Paenibacillus larvae subsp. pulvifaciens]AVF26480.1 spore germination-like protein [Paenibacillus larvae subsp. larvae]AVF31256.1 spore germination-like protein [Paenibacillus larvae subsp. larvae]MCY7521838.1 spore germination protein GerPB [Paenibacillus larvae]
MADNKSCNLSSFTVNQTITIHQIRIEVISNSSVFQIGTAGVIKSLSNIYNTGGFTAPVPQFGQDASHLPYSPMVPLPPLR